VLKLLEKVGQPRGQRWLDSVVLTEALPDYPLSIARKSGAPNRFVAAFEHGLIPMGSQK
jgi:hypothetical protein